MNLIAVVSKYERPYSAADSDAKIAEPCNALIKPVDILKDNSECGEE